MGVAIHPIPESHIKGALMIDTDGPYLLVLIYQWGFRSGGISTEILASFEACRAVLTQLEIVDHVKGFCVAAAIKE